MKRIATVVLLMMSAAPAHAESIFDKTLAMWAPKAIEQSQGVLTVVLPQPRVTDEIYQAVVKIGVCGALNVDEAALDGVKEIRVLNINSARGFVAEGGKVLCQELNAASDGRVDDFTGVRVDKATLLGVTHVY